MIKPNLMVKRESKFKLFSLMNKIEWPLQSQIRRYQTVTPLRTRQTPYRKMCTELQESLVLTINLVSSCLIGIYSEMMEIIIKKLWKPVWIIVGNHYFGRISDLQ